VSRLLIINSPTSKAFFAFSILVFHQTHPESKYHVKKINLKSKAGPIMMHRGNIIYTKMKMGNEIKSESINVRQNINNSVRAPLPTLNACSNHQPRRWHWQWLSHFLPHHTHPTKANANKQI
jgi:hypothetical protein